VGNGVGRVANMLVYTLRVMLPAQTRMLPRPDVVIGSSVHPFAAVAGLKLARRHGVPFVFEVRDLWPKTLIDMGRLKQGRPLTRMFQYMEKWLYLRSDRIIVLLPYAADYIVPLGIPSSRIIWIPNGVDIENSPVPPPPQPHELFTLMYFGAHGNANGLKNILEAIARLERYHPDMPISMRLVGDGPLKSCLMERARDLGLRRVRFENPVPKNRIPSLMAEADAFVFSLVSAPVFRYGVSSNKLFDFMAGARPIIFCCDAANNPVAEAGAGLTVKPEDPVALSEAILQLYSAPIAERHAMGTAGRHYVEKNHDFRQLSMYFASILDDLANSPTPKLNA